MLQVNIGLNEKAQSESLTRRFFVLFMFEESLADPTKSELRNQRAVTQSYKQCVHSSPDTFSMLLNSHSSAIDGTGRLFCHDGSLQEMLARDWRCLTRSSVRAHLPAVISLAARTLALSPLRGSNVLRWEPTSVAGEGAAMLTYLGFYSSPATTHAPVRNCIIKTQFYHRAGSQRADAQSHQHLCSLGKNNSIFIK